MGKDSDKFKFSVVIRNRNEAEYIGFAIQSIIDHVDMYPQIIVVDNNSTDDSLSVVKLFNKADIEIIHCDNYTPGRALNMGAEVARYENLLIMSAHSQITRFDNETAANELEDYCAVFGMQTPIYRGKKITKRYIWSHFINKSTINMWSIPENRYFLHNAFAMFKTNTLMEFPFDEELAGKEDRYWANHMILEQNKKIKYSPTSFRCNHYWTPNGATWKGIG